MSDIKVLRGNERDGAFDGFIAFIFSYVISYLHSILQPHSIHLLIIKNNT